MDICPGCSCAARFKPLGDQRDDNPGKDISTSPGRHSRISGGVNVYNALRRRHYCPGALQQRGHVPGSRAADRRCSQARGGQGEVRLSERARRRNALRALVRAEAERLVPVAMTEALFKTVAEVPVAPV